MCNSIVLVASASQCGKMHLNSFIYVVICGFFGSGLSSIAVVDIDFENALIAQKGFGWPAVVKVAPGNEALMKLRLALEEQRSCSVMDPSGVQFDIAQPPSDRFERWSADCGVRIKNVGTEDAGRWRLTAAAANDSITGWVELDVLEEAAPESPPPILLQDGARLAEVPLSALDNTYCVVAKPFAESALVGGRCSLTLERATRAVQGSWSVLLGLPGRVAELQTRRQVTVNTERLDAGYEHAAGRLNLYCNILHSVKEVTFCRFQRTADDHGYNVVDGLSDGSYSYYGDGFVSNQCGMTIESPTSQDYSTWRCSVGVQMLVGNEMQQQTPMQALISVAPSSRSAAEDDDVVDGVRTVLVQQGAPFTLRCHAAAALRYCWFQHPNGTQFTPVALAHEQQLFWYTGESLEVGDCGITFASSEASDDGAWSCSMGPRGGSGVELRDAVTVRVGGALAATRSHVAATLGANATLACRSAGRRRPLEYCRFLSPALVGMNLDSTVTPDNAVLGRYHFTAGRELDSGDCSLTISSVREEDAGTWTCAALLDDDTFESRDNITLLLEETHHVPRLQAGVVGAIVGLSALAVVLLGYVTHKRGWLRVLATLPRGRRTVVSQDYSLQSRNTASGSISSGSSTELTAARP